MPNSAIPGAVDAEAEKKLAAIAKIVGVDPTDAPSIVKAVNALVAEPDPDVRRAAARFAAFVATREPAQVSSDAADAAGVDPWDRLGPVAW